VQQTRVAPRRSQLTPRLGRLRGAFLASDSPSPSPHILADRKAQAHRLNVATSRRSPLTAPTPLVVAHWASQWPRRPRTQPRASSAVDGSPTLARRPPRRRLQAIRFSSSSRPAHFTFGFASRASQPFCSRGHRQQVRHPLGLNVRHTLERRRRTRNALLHSTGGLRARTVRSAHLRSRPGSFSRGRRRPQPSSTRPVSIRPA